MRLSPDHAAGVSRRRFLAIGAGLAVVAVAGCRDRGYNGPVEDDVLPLAVLPYPDAVLVDQTFTREQSGRSVDLENLAKPALLQTTFELDEPVELGVLIDWYSAEAAADGWRPVADGLEQVVDGRVHRSWLAAMSETDAGFGGILANAPRDYMTRRYVLVYTIGLTD